MSSKLIVLAIVDSMLSLPESTRRHLVIVDCKKFLISFSLLKDRSAEVAVSGVVRNMGR